MGAHVLLLLLGVLSAADLASAVLWDVRMDCGVSVWSGWGPTTNGSRTRTRQIFRYPQFGGAPCPSLSETDEDPWVPTTVTVKAAKIEGSFLRGGGGPTGRPHQETIWPRDILFIIDMSGSISAGNYEAAKRDVSDLIGKICGRVGLEDQNNRVAVITFSHSPVENFDFDKYSNLRDVQQAVLNLPRKGGSTCTGTALNYAQGMFGSSKGARSDFISVKEVVVLTDGQSNCGPDVVKEAMKLQNIKTPPVSMFVFAISDLGSRGRMEMEGMASTPTSNHLFHFPNFLDFTKTVQEILTYPSSCAPIVVG